MAIDFVAAPNPWGASGLATLTAKRLDPYLLASEAASRCARLRWHP
jgi:hypothetical protein